MKGRAAIAFWSLALCCHFTTIELVHGRVGPRSTDSRFSSNSRQRCKGSAEPLALRILPLEATADYVGQENNQRQECRGYDTSNDCFHYHVLPNFRKRLR